MKIRDNSHLQALGGMQIKLIPMGEVFDGTIGSDDGTFFRIYGGVVSLVNPGHSWFNCGAMTVKAYRPRAATLTLNEYLPPRIEAEGERCPLEWSKSPMEWSKI